MGIRVGIDLGTTFCSVARINPNTGRPEIIQNSFGSGITPSVLCFEENGNVLFGEDAKDMQLSGNPNTIAFFKRCMGMESYSCEFFGKKYTATDFSAILLRKLKEDAEKSIGEEIDAAVITVPAYFQHKERRATMEAGKMAGLEVLAVINEPTAAAFAYGLHENDEDQTVLIYDLGGGTFDVTIARITGDCIRTLGSDGDHELGGKDWDDCLAQYLSNQFAEQYHEDFSEDAGMTGTVLVTAEKVKKQLTSRDAVTVPMTYRNVHGKIDVTIETFEAITQHLMGTTRDVIERLMDSLKMSWNDIDGVILVGGSTRMRMIENFVFQMSGKKPLRGVNADEAVALGAAIRANITDKGKTLPGIMGRSRSAGQREIAVAGAKAVIDVTAHSLGMISIDKEGKKHINGIIIPKNTSIPACKMRPFLATNNEAEVYVLQGEYERPLDNTVINKYVISKIQTDDKGEAVIEISYEYTANGIVEVSAVQRATKKKLPIRIEPDIGDLSWTDLPPKKDTVTVSKNNVNVFLAIDLSGSMSGKPLREAQTAMKDFVRNMRNKVTRIGIIAFSDTVDMAVKPTSDMEEVLDGISKLQIGGELGYGNEAQPFTTARKTFKEMSLNKKGDVNYIVTLTDGIWSYTERAIDAAHECHDDHIEIIALGFGNADHDFLKKIASTDRFATVTELTNLKRSFSKIAQVIEESSGLRKA